MKYTVKSSYSLSLLFSEVLAACNWITPLSGISYRAAAAGMNVSYQKGCDINSTDTSGEGRQRKTPQETGTERDRERRQRKR